MIIYKITNKINGRVYIGQTVYPLENRWMRHCRKSSNSAISKAIKKYGSDNFQVETIETCQSLESLDRSEMYWIKFYNSTNRDLGYNRTHGGQSGGLVGEPLERMKLGVSKALKGKRKPKRTPEQIQKHRNAITGKPNLKKRKPVWCSNGVSYGSIEEAAELLNLSKGNIHGVVSGHRKSCGGLTFGYI